jgi:pimeloyl-ACP methyl ester carboxylesterase
MSWRLHVERWGDSGPVVVLVHGMGASGRAWRWVGEQLADGHRIIAPTLLGFGRSPWPKLEYTMEQHLDLLADALRHEGVAGEKLVVAGHSVGAVQALAWAAREPARFQGLLLAGLPVYRSPDEARRQVAAMGPLGYITVKAPRFGALFCNTICRFGRTRLATPLWRIITPLMFSYVPVEVARDGAFHGWESYTRTLRNCLLDVDVESLARSVEAARIPVRLLHGELDREAPVDSAVDIAGRHGWRCETVPAGAHNLIVRQPGRCAELIRELITR